MRQKLSCATLDWTLSSFSSNIDQKPNGFDHAETGLVYDQVRDVLLMQQEALSKIGERLAATASENCTDDLKERLAMVNASFGSSIASSFERIMSAPLLQVDSAANAAVQRVLEAFRRMLNLMMSDVDKAASPSELSNAVAAVIGWIDDAPISLEMWLRDVAPSVLDGGITGAFRQANCGTQNGVAGSDYVLEDVDGSQEVTIHAGRREVSPVCTGNRTQRRGVIKGIFAA